MNNVPLPGQPDDESDWLYDNYERDVFEVEWSGALAWAQKGDFVPLAELLRRPDMPLDHVDVRNWLADGLVEGFKKPSKVAKRPIKVPFVLANGRTIYIYERHMKQFEAMTRADQLMSTMDRAHAIEKAADEFGIQPPDRYKGTLTPAETLSGYLSRARSKWGLHPVENDTMFDDIAPSYKKDEIPR